MLVVLQLCSPELASYGRYLPASVASEFDECLKGLLCDTNLLNRLGDGFALPLQDFGFAQFADDRISGVSFLGRVPALLSVKILT